MLPVVGVRLAEGRSGSTLLMQLLATDPRVVFDRKYPAEYRFLSYFARMSASMTEPFDSDRHVGVTPFFFGPDPTWGPIPFSSDVIESSQLSSSLLRGLWSGWSEEIRRSFPPVRYYAEKLAVDVDVLVAAEVPLRVVDLVRDPRDVLASIKAFTAGGTDGFGRERGVSDEVYADAFASRFDAGLRAMVSTPSGVDRLIVRYEDMVRDLGAAARRIGDWLDLDLDAKVVQADREAYTQHIRSESPESSIGRWTSDLSDTEIGILRDRLSESVRPFGYRMG